MGNTNSAIKGLASDFAGTSDICDVVTDLSDAWAASYLLPGEEILYALQSVRQEFAFTNRALIQVIAESSTTTKRVVERFEYKTSRVEDVNFESTGVVDRDCELRVKVGKANLRIAIERSKEEEVKSFYKALIVLGHTQKENEIEWELTQTAVATAKDTVRVSEGDRQSLNKQSDETLGWLKTQYERTHPHNYKDVIEGALAAARAEMEKGE
ncbi:Uncharacterized protein P3T76_005448 [Phytophthora citrophthora]|uniref:Bacterial Pleckstrin homology domain-containing protein n=1 Tax=Phytophthora citrophthora TaxID=4793 RepID=A0AAD9GRG2_9STRA|nr:Uncharacterized protein P3T76_005448 [Phytophthora citrophthora]